MARLAVIVYKSAREIDEIRASGRVAAAVMAEVIAAALPGVRTAELDRLAEDSILKLGGQPAIKGLNGFPATLCLAVNNEVANGLPGRRRLRDGDIVSIDVGVRRGQWYADLGTTFAVGAVPAPPLPA